MTDDRKGKAGLALGAADIEIARLASRAISLLLEAQETSREALELRLRLMCDAFLSEREETRHAMLLRLRQDGIAVPDIIDCLIPEVARFMGRRWGADEISFADVTIGTARLQEAVRALTRRLDRDEFLQSAAKEERDANAARERVLLVVPRPEHHTLGTFVVADQLRRFGYGVDVAVDRHPRQIAQLMRKSRYSMVGVTAAGRRALASSRELVDTIRASVVRVPPIVLGGSIVAEEESDLRLLTGVDHVAADASAALHVCGLERVEDLARAAPQGCRFHANAPAGIVSA